MTLGLPPLPSSPGTPAGRPAAAVLADEHRQLAALCAALSEPGIAARRRRDLADVLTATAARHLSAEAQYLYPAVRSAVPGEGDALADREVAATRDLLAALRAGKGAEEKLRRHAYATADLLDRLAAVASAEDLVRLGNRIETAEEAAPTRPHPGAPAAPWNKITDPAIGLLDRLRDAVTGRPTRPESLTSRYATRLF